MKSRHGLRQRLTRQLGALAVLPLLAVMVVAGLVLLPSLLRSGDERNFELATAIRDQVQQQLAARQRLALQLADEIGSRQLQGAEIVATLRSLIGNDPLLLVAYVTDRRGIVEQVASREESQLVASDLVGLDQSSQLHFLEARRTGRPVWSETFLSLLTGRITAVLVVPFGERTLFVELALDGLSQTLADIGASSRTRAVILDRLGRIIGHPDARRALQQDSLTELALVRRAIAGQSGTDQITSDGVPHLAHALPVQPIGWTILVMQPTRQVLGPLITLGLMLAGIIAATVAVSLLLVRTLASRTGREVERLAEAAQSAAGAPQAAGDDLKLSIAEFQALWERLRTLFAELHERDRQTDGARRELQAVLDAATEVAIIATDRDGTVRMFSRGAAKLLGHAPEAVVGRVTPELWHDAEEVARRGAELSLRFGRPIRGFEVLVYMARHAGYEVRDWSFVRADASRVEVSLAVTAMRSAEGHLEGFLGVAIDVSQRRRAAELELARRTAENANQAKTEFLSRMSHELRTPLNAVLGYAQLMELSPAEPPGPEQLQRLQQIQRSGWHLVRLIDDVLDLTRIEAGSVNLAIEAVDIGAAIERSRGIVAPLLGEHDAHLVIATAERGDPLPPVRADLTRLVQVLVNLLSNAAKYGRHGGQVRLSCSRSGSERLRIEVRDDGLGMSEEQLAQLFQPFNRLGRETSGIAGTGIGLVITKRNLELMDGTIDVASRPGVGTTVTVTLPLAGAPNTMPADKTLAAPAVAAAPADGATVLHIEDDPVNARLMRELLRQRPGLRLLEASTLGHGLQLAARQRPDVVLLDLHLPDSHGAEGLARLATDAATAGVPVVVVSADATQAQVDALLSAGAHAYLTKPVRVADTLAIVDQLLGVRV